MATPESQDPSQPPRRALGRAAVFGAMVLGAVIGGVAVEYWLTTRAVSPAVAQTSAAPSADVVADVAFLKSVLATQSHTMTDVGNHWSNLWFAVERKNWPLAAYYFAEARQSVRWTVLLRPVRKLPDGKTVDIRGLFDGIDPSAFATVQLAIEDRDSGAFVEAYKQTLQACYMCHKAAGRPELRPMVPTTPSATIINADPNAEWPK